mgnify:FL=1
MVLIVHFTEIQKFIYNFRMMDKKLFVDKYWWLFSAQIKNVRFFSKVSEFPYYRSFSYILVFFSGCSSLCIAVTTWMFDQHPTSFWPSPHFMSLAEPSCADTLQRPSFYPPIGPPCLTYYRPSCYKEFPISTQVRGKKGRPFYGS